MFFLPWKFSTYPGGVSVTTNTAKVLNISIYVGYMYYMFLISPLLDKKKEKSLNAQLQIQRTSS